MKSNRNRKNSRVVLLRPGVTLLELAVVITVLLMLVSLLFPAAGAWKKGSDRAQCILNIRNVQLGVRSFSNLAGFDYGTDVSTMSPPKVLQDEIVGAERFVETAPDCPSSGTYRFGGNVIPDRGSLYMMCSLAASDRHVPDDHTGW